MRFRLASGKYAQLDPDDHARLRSKFRYHLTPHGYAKRSSYLNGKLKCINMHHDILPAKNGYYVDHIDGDKLNNRRSNLRYATPSVSSQNRRGRGINGYKGVQANHKRWQAMIMVNWKRYSLGTYDTAKEAALAYDRAARQHHGANAYVNFPLTVAEVKKHNMT